MRRTPVLFYKSTKRVEQGMKGKKKIWKKVLLLILIIIVILAIGMFVYLYFNGLSGMRSKKDASDGQIKVACVGDSITYGHGVSNWPKNNYPKVLGNLLGETYNVRNFGFSGRTAMETGDQPYTAEALYQESLDYEADIVVLMLGTNDSKPENWQGADEFKAQYEKLVESYLADGKEREVYLCTPAKAFYIHGETEGVTSFDICDEQVAEIVDIVREVAAEMELTVIDIRALTEEHAEWFEKDGVHPNADGAAAIAQEVYRVIRK